LSVIDQELFFFFLTFFVFLATLTTFFGFAPYTFLSPFSIKELNEALFIFSKRNGAA
jgi:hypothetical protein